MQLRIPCRITLCKHAKKEQRDQIYGYWGYKGASLDVAKCGLECEAIDDANKLREL